MLDTFGDLFLNYTSIIPTTLAVSTKYICAANIRDKGDCRVFCNHFISAHILVLKPIVQYLNIQSLTQHSNRRTYPDNCHTPHVMFHMCGIDVMAIKSRQLRSPVWDYFEIVGEKKVCCKFCVPPATTTLAYHGGITSMQEPPVEPSP